MNPMAAQLAQGEVAKAEPKVVPSDINMLFDHLATKGIESNENSAYWDKAGQKWTIGLGLNGLMRRFGQTLKPER